MNTFHLQPIFVRSLATLALVATAFGSPVQRGASQYTLVKEYSGATFFDGWNFQQMPYGSDPTHGYVNYLDSKSAASQGLAGYWYDAGANETTAYIGVDHTNPAPQGRNSVRLNSADSWSNGGLFVADIRHSPLGTCGSWGAFWLVGPDWPNQGEIDIVEGVNNNQYNSMTLHTAPGCSTTNDSSLFAGTLAQSDCDATLPGNAGCGIVAPASISLAGTRVPTVSLAPAGAGFNAQGGAVYATLWTDAGIAIYAFPRDDMPADLAAGKPTPDLWSPKPLARFSGSGCSFLSAFRQLSLVLNIDLCGDWPNAVWNTSSCAAKAATCNDFVANNPQELSEAYWRIASVKVYQTGPAGSG